ncbi:MAG: GNAT family N-acetyltransferase [Hyphomicrobiales bacterium]|nr:MAG: GNAT family N-acetyltransferase [Hyphomicrobiales bacterium]
MQLLDGTAYEAVRPLLTETISRHATAAAILAGALEGKVWANDPVRPSVTLISDGEASYLAGDPAQLAEPEALRALIPAWTYFFPEANWVSQLSSIWDNPFARPHPRLRFELERAEPDGGLPAGFELVPINRNSVAGYPALYEFAEGEGGGWRSFEDFLDIGVGYVVLRDGGVVSHSLADCVVGNRAELGVETQDGYRRLGLGRAAAAAAVNECLRRGIVDVGWHCHASNAGSIRLAEATGFRLQDQYFGYSSNLPAENVGDLSEAQCRDWAAHLELAAESVLWHGFHAGGAWALAGEPERALGCLDRMVSAGWRGRADWLEQHWAYAAIRGSAEFKAIVARQRG